jgi:hypothetical protein
VKGKVPEAARPNALEPWKVNCAHRRPAGPRCVRRTAEEIDVSLAGRQPGTKIEYITENTPPVGTWLTTSPFATGQSIASPPSCS